MDHDEIVRLYGPWRARTPQDVVELFEGYAGRWWIAGGWAIEAFTGVARPHGDVDPSIPRSDVDDLRRHLSGRLDVWQADDGTLRPLVGDSESLTETCENLWLRRDGSSSWEYDVILMELGASMWTYKRDSRIRLPVEEIFWERDGVSYLRPEVQLLHKARALRPQDQADFDAAAHLLEPARRGWLRDALATAHAGHPWVDAL
ncbi:nucleotidyltransferase domain-containing protein [Nocardioides sp.]|uniref:nucleotidyltransferase domain-containing protein n=1 Tax=Nocardioides sp. TaxID=35761 RepID=UPI0035AF1529